MDKYEELKNLIKQGFDLAIDNYEHSIEADSKQHEFDRGVLFAYTKMMSKINNLEKGES